MTTTAPSAIHVKSSALQADLSVEIDPNRTWCNETYFTVRLQRGVRPAAREAEVKVGYVASFTQGTRATSVRQSGEVTLPTQGGSKEVVVTWSQPKDADPDVDFTVCVEVDPERRIIEASETNNKVCFSGTTVS
ncbi:MAG: hypothetical protein M3134_11000 [Actinomycetota bacterium]|nr:hypothetical protein [Actinomycetota bacterium]